ncbi:MAG: fibronectin type III domain-containing protein [bacterium]|jgi:hypothetical protein|nr:fibronectin type III domain-containing protein [bacterium]MBK9472218.1 fibronectin type III domain-containing protein [bacterium]
MNHLRTIAGTMIALFLLGALAGCGGGGDPVAPDDGTPAAVTDLETVAGTDNSVTLAWTVPAAAAKAGGSLAYDLRYTLLGQEAADRSLWTAAPAPLALTGAGQTQMHVVTGLAAGSTYVFSLAARYGSGAWSTPSAPAVGTAAVQPDQTPPARVQDLVQYAGTTGSLTVAWSLAGDDTIYGRAEDYEVRYAGTPLTAETWAAATVADEVPEAHPVPGRLMLTIDGLVEGQTYHVGLKALDDAGHASALSNVVTASAVAMRTIHVRVDGSGDYARLNDAIHAAMPGDVVLVGPGRYTWTNQGDGDATQGLFVVRRDQTDFTIRSEAGAAATILDAERQGRVMYVVGGTFGSGEERTWAGVTIEGFTFVNGLALGVGGELGPPWAGAGLALHLTDTLVRDCIFRDNEAIEGGAVWMGGQGGSRLENCLLENNEAESGGAVHLVNSEPVMSLSGCIIRNNVASLAGGAIYAANVGLEMDDTLVHGNLAIDRGGAMYIAALHDGSWIEGCSFLGNTAPIASGLRLAYPMTLTLRRSLVAANGGGAGIEIVAVGVGSGAVLKAGCNLVFGNNGGNAWPIGTIDLGGNLASDPLLCPDGLHPSAGSPCLPGNRAGGDECGLIGALGQGCGG